MYAQAGRSALAFCFVVAAGNSLAQGAAETAPAKEPKAVAETLDTIPVPLKDDRPVLASVEATPETAKIKALIVTAQKRKQSINDVPITISAFSGEDLAALGVTDIRDIGVLVPSLSVNDSGQGTPIYTLRSVGFNDTTYLGVLVPVV